MDSERVQLTTDDYRRLAEFRYRIRCFLSFSAQAARAAGLEPRQHQLLLALKGLPDDLEPSIGDLAQRLQLRHNTVVELIDRLETHGYVRRRQGTEDRRKVYVDLTRDGETVLADLSRHHLDELRSIGPDLAQTLSDLVGDRG